MTDWTIDENCSCDSCTKERLSRSRTPAPEQPVTGCWYYDHNVCGLPHPCPIREEHDTAIRKHERERFADLITEIIGVLVSSEGFVPTAIRCEVMRLREKLESLRESGEESHDNDR